MDIEARVIKIIAEQLGAKPEEILPDSHMADDLGADSLDAVELVIALEEEFRLEIPDEEAERMKKVKDVITYLEKKLEGK